jgi:hypothetical protein
MVAGCLAGDFGITRHYLERVKGIEPSYAAWEAAVLPLNYTRAPKASHNTTPHSRRNRLTQRLASSPGLPEHRRALPHAPRIPPRRGSPRSY